MTQQPFRRRDKIHEPFVQRETEQAEGAGDDEPPLNRSLTPEERDMILVGLRRARMGLCLTSKWSMVVVTILVLFAGSVGIGAIGVALLDNAPSPAMALAATQTARPTLPPTVTDTPTMTPPLPTPTPARTLFPTVTPKPDNRIPAQMIAGPELYGWYDKMENEDSAVQALCKTPSKELCDFGFSAATLGLWTGNWPNSPQRFTLWLKFDGKGMYYYLLTEERGEIINLDPYIGEFDHLDLSRGICVPAIWNIQTTDEIEEPGRLNGRIGHWVRRVLLGEAGVGELGEQVSGIPDLLQLEIWDKPPRGCIQITDDFPSVNLPVAETEQ